MNREMKRIYSIMTNIHNIYVFQDFINLNIKSLCFCENPSLENCVLHLFQKIVDGILNSSNNEKLIKDFNCSCNEIIFNLLSWIIYIFDV